MRFTNKSFMSAVGLATSLSTTSTSAFTSPQIRRVVSSAIFQRNAYTMTPFPVSSKLPSALFSSLPGIPSEPTSLLPLVPSFVRLSSGTEFDSYKEPQWRFLFSGEDVIGYLVQTENNEEKIIKIKGGRDETKRNEANTKIYGGCVIRITLDGNTAGFGMVLVDPSQRGKGLAKLLLNSAFEKGEDNAPNNERFVLAVCTQLGQPVYRKLGFTDVGTVAAMVCSVSDIWGLPEEDLSEKDLHCTAYASGDLSKEQQQLLVDLDQKATGYNREGRLKVILDGYSQGSRSTVAFMSSNSGNKTHEAVAVARQDLDGGPLIIGPIIGPDECCIPLVRALVRKHFDSNGQQLGDDVKDGIVSMLVSDHPNVVQRLLEVKGMKQMWENPAMSSDGKPIYPNGDGSYLALLHPTLG